MSGAKSGARTQGLKAFLAARPGAVAQPVVAPRGVEPIALMYKIMGKLFAVLSVRGEEYVILKCDPHLADMLREKYAGVGHRSHLDRRYWVSVSLDADLPEDEIARLADQSYALVCQRHNGHLNLSKRNYALRKPIAFPSGEMDWAISNLEIGKSPIVPPFQRAKIPTALRYRPILSATGQNQFEPVQPVD